MQDALSILNSCDQNIFRGYAADITLLNIDYIASKQSKSMRDFLRVVNQTFTIMGADNEMFNLGLQLNNDDLEDNIQYLCAKTIDCKVIVSNDKKFYKGDIEILSSSAFVSQYIH